MGGLAGEAKGLVTDTLIIDGLSQQRSSTFITLDYFADGSYSTRIKADTMGTFIVTASADGVHFLTTQSSTVNAFEPDYAMPNCPGPASVVKVAPGITLDGSPTHMRVRVYQYGGD